METRLPATTAPIYPSDERKEGSAVPQRYECHPASNPCASFYRGTMLALLLVAQILSSLSGKVTGLISKKVIARCALAFVKAADASTPRLFLEVWAYTCTVQPGLDLNGRVAFDSMVCTVHEMQILVTVHGRWHNSGDEKSYKQETKTC